MRPPVANSSDFSKDHFGYKPVDEVLAVDVRWGEDDLDNVNVSILIRGIVFGVLTTGAKPGWSLVAKKDGPLAKVLSAAPEVPVAWSAT